MMNRNDFLPDDLGTIVLIDREVRLDADGVPWIGRCEPVLREQIREVYRKLCESGETGRQIVAVHQEIAADLQAIIDKQNRRRQRRRAAHPKLHK